MGTPTSENTRVALKNVGCKLNAYEVEALAHRLTERGYAIVPFGSEADVYVVNTCTVTGAGDADSRKAVRRARRRNPSAEIVATGCYAQRRPADLAAAGADLVVGNGQKAQLVELLEAHLAGAEPPAPSATRPRTEQFLTIDGAVPQGRTRGSLQIQDGCDEHCTYCIIPAVRGHSASRPAAEVVVQAQRMVAAGYRELALTGVHTGRYGFDQGQSGALVKLLAALEQIDGLARIRLNSIEPGYVTDALIDQAAASPAICRHFHVPLQSGDDHILKRMGRRYTRAYYAERIERIASRIPDCAIGADVMVGFPGETDAHFAQTRPVSRPAADVSPRLFVLPARRHPGRTPTRAPRSRCQKGARSSAHRPWRSQATRLPPALCRSVAPSPCRRAFRPSHRLASRLER